jgi:hypothetical protein
MVDSFTLNCCATGCKQLIDAGTIFLDEKEGKTFCKTPVSVPVQHKRNIALRPKVKCCWSSGEFESLLADVTFGTGSCC